MKIKLIWIVMLLSLNACVSKKKIFYLQDVDSYNNASLTYGETKIQPNDILKITVGALVPETAIPFNKLNPLDLNQNTLELMKLNGYLVSKEKTIVFPSLGKVSVENMSTAELERYLEQQLTDGGYLKDPTVTIRILNAKVTILGEVNAPGTYEFTEESISLLQALGYAGDLTIRGKRDDVLIMREVDGIRKVTHLDLTTADWLDSPFSYIKPNDVIVVNQNPPKVTSAGYIGDIGTILGLSSLILSIVILVTK
ncbi:polysaccharide biosynthesis/export family protein [Xanthomarina sp. F1114]|uniref:polysaccharide biosynthesis/export family protein n=1 Tax=Xanthomarina sp. F1114 TaxID=2996019 RepID=UPI00225E36C0|nr:polysaccharide biosynthesis/export family protein [Xanthomarina sp. F1114]MCX7548880.1 polysaccharide biosynthesis/export family protein [Xanthomarina sp. F1114]